MSLRGLPLTGELVVEECEGAPVRSVEVQLLRVESTSSASSDSSVLVRRPASEVQTLQAADGDVARNSPVPLHMALPRRFACESTEVAGVFAVDFEINVVVVFGDNFVVAENIPITVVRHEAKKQAE